MPENGLEFGQVGFREIGTSVDRAIIHAANFEWQRIRLRRNDEICAQAAEFSGKAVTDIERHAQRGRSHGHAERQRRPGQELMARPPSKRIRYKS